MSPLFDEARELWIVTLPAAGAGGAAREVLAAYVAGRLHDERYRLPEAQPAAALPARVDDR